MDFGKILDAWDNNKEREEPSRDDLEKWIDTHGIQDKDNLPAAHVKNKQDKIEERSKLRSMRPEAVVDLHGLKKDEALGKLEGFLTESRRKGLKKVLIIHGKGIHSQQGPVLGKAVREFLEQSPVTGEAGTAARQDGGKGAVWVLLR